MENLTCGILRMRKDGSVKFIRAPKVLEPEGCIPLDSKQAINLQVGENNPRLTHLY